MSKRESYKNTKRVFKVGGASVSYGQPKYGPPRIIADALLDIDAEGFDDLVKAVELARDHWLDSAQRGGASD